MKAKLAGFLFFSSLLFRTVVFAQTVVQNEWTEIKQENDIIVSLGETFLDGINYLKVQFTNQSNQEQLIAWSLSKGEKIIVRGRIQTIAPKATIELFGASLPIPIGMNENVEDFRLSINKSIQTQI